MSYDSKVSVEEQWQYTYENSAEARRVMSVDESGNYVVAGGGTQYTEDAAAPANPVGTANALVRQDTPAGLVSADGDIVIQRATNYGAAFSQIVDSSGNFVDTFGGGTQYTEGDVDASFTGTMAMWEDAGNVAATVSSSNPLPTSITGSAGGVIVENSLDFTAYDLNAAAFSETTNISSDYILDSIELNFSTAESKTITVTSEDGTIIYEDTNTNQSISIGDINTAYDSDNNITVNVTQFSSAGTMDCILKTKTASASLVGTPFVKIQGYEGSAYQDIRIDGSTHTIITLTNAHHEIHDGNHYYIEGYTTLASSAELRVKLVTPNTTKWSHFLWEIESSGILTTELYEGASGGMTGGSAVTIFNSNRNSANTSGMTITSGVTTATSDGTLISQGSWNSRSGGKQSREDEIILKQNTTYLRKFTSGSNSNLVSFKASWYEHTNKS